MQIYNTETGHKEPFEVKSLPVKMYVCGLTPKNEPHIGHALLFTFNDTVRRYLEYRGYPVRYVQNFTDIDDKIIAAGLREGIPPAEAAERYTTAYFRDMHRLNIRDADEFPYVTRYISQIIETIQGLIEKGHAYQVGGDVYFSVPTFPEYGRLSGRNDEAMQAGARIEPDERKHDPRDFALWKSAKPGEPWWESPWGKGRPGWHIECSTMSMNTLGPEIDIHGGGADLIFPHHENEIAQSEAYSGHHPFVRYWLHTGLLSLQNEAGAREKIAHSGTFITISSILDGMGVPGPALRTYLLGQHYRASLVWSEEQLRASTSRWRRWAQTRENLLRLIAFAEEHRAKGKAANASPAAVAELRGQLAQAKADFVEAMDDDFNTPRALAAIDELAKRVNDFSAGISGNAVPKETLAVLREALVMLEELTGAIGIELVAEQSQSARMSDEDVAKIEVLVAAREDARKAKNWAEADRVRNELLNTYAVVVKDTPQGPTWSVQAPEGKAEGKVEGKVETRTLPTAAAKPSAATNGDGTSGQ